MKSLQELRELKEKSLASLKVRHASDEQTIKIHVGMGTCGIASGARDTFMSMLDEIKNLNLENISLTQVGCMGNCYEEPVVRVIYQGQEPKIYTNVDAQKAKEIVNNLNS